MEMALSAKDYTLYESPLGSRWRAKEMAENFSPLHRCTTWRRLWIALAESQKELGINITDKQIAEMKNAVGSIDFDLVAEEEKKRRHDVMAHIHAFAAAAPGAKGIIHLGATSCFVTDNADAILIREGMEILKKKIVNVIAALAEFAGKYADTPCLGRTHLQPAQLTTIGKRATLWMQDLLLDLSDLEARIADIPFRGAKGTTGTQDSYLKLFDGDEKKVETLDKMIAEKMGFENRCPVTGQTYPRKLDWRIMSVLSGIAQSSHKFGDDIRILQGLGEIQEPFGEKQTGSSAMPYKRNPMRSERICSLAKHVINLAQNASFVASTQWLERTLDDSAIRRITIPEAFIATDIILNIYLNVARGPVVIEQVVKRLINENLPFIAAEEIMMECVKAGGDRQELHEAIRTHSMAALEKVRCGQANDLIDRIKADKLFAAVKDRLKDMLDPKRHIGLAPQQTRRFLDEHIRPVLKKHKALLGLTSDLQV